jgi:hypothetical protein
MMPSPRPHNARQAWAGLELGLGTVARANPIVVAWRWRYELLAMTGLAAVWLALGTAAASAVTAGLAVALAALAAVPEGRRLLVARAWCVVTPHRVRVGCAQAWIHSRSGKIPAVLFTLRQPFGERVYLWCRAGTSAGDLASARELLAAACWADDVRVSRSPRHAHIVTLDVIRRGQPGAAAGPGQAGRVSAATPALSVPPMNGPAGDGYAGDMHDDDVRRRQISA